MQGSKSRDSTHPSAIAVQPVDFLVPLLYDSRAVGPYYSVLIRPKAWPEFGAAWDRSQGVPGETDTTSLHTA